MDLLNTTWRLAGKLYNLYKILRIRKLDFWRVSFALKRVVETMIPAALLFQIPQNAKRMKKATSLQLGQLDSDRAMVQKLGSAWRM